MFRYFSITLLLITLVGLPGCAWFRSGTTENMDEASGIEVIGKENTDGASPFGGRERRSRNSIRMTGLSDEARDIERRLGGIE